MVYDPFRFWTKPKYHIKFCLVSSHYIRNIVPLLLVINLVLVAQTPPYMTLTHSDLLTIIPDSSGSLNYVYPPFIKHGVLENAPAIDRSGNFQLDTVDDTRGYPIKYT